MKTIISLSDSLYKKAEEIALFLGISRSTLFAIAMEEFITKLNGKMIIEKINRVYEKINTKEYEPYLNTGLESVRNLTKNETW